MAQVILSRVGAALGARVAPVFSRLGRTIGAAIGRRIDTALTGDTRRVEGPRLTELHLQSSEEGASLPLVFGRARLAGQVIWAARYRETASTQSSGGGKSGRPRTTTTSYSYSLSFAVGLCAGEIARVERAWVNGRPFDLAGVVHRVHRGGEDQAVDPLIEAIEGVDAAPAYRGLAYVVFEDLPLEAFGNAIPQLSFEIVRAPASEGPRLETLAQAVCLIPGSGEFVYATELVRRVIAAGAEAPENAHAAADRTNIEVSLDQLQSDLPNVGSVTLVAAWFGDDLRCGACEIRPGVEIAAKETRPRAWHAGGVDRAGARLVSQSAGAPAYGGTPDDAGVLEAIAALKARGLAVGLNPFLLMDIPADNALPDPHGGTAQAAYPWRGRISCMPAPGQPGTVDKTAAAAAQVESFFGNVAATDFATAGDIACTAPDWKYRQFILHYAHLAARAGGVDHFVIGSELRGLTTVRDSATTFPAVDHLRALAADVRAIVGPDVAIAYGADWTEYAGHRPQDGSGDVFFHLDPLWADPEIAAIGVDWYPPLSDWRDGEAHLDRALSRDGHDVAYLAGRIEAGEAYDWFYASEEDRAAQVRTPITDGAYGEPWVYRVKDIRSFWSNAHHNRPGGVRSATPTAWIPESKPVWFMELGAPAIDKGANGPNVFLDPKSAESAAPPFSSGARDDLVQRRALEAYLTYWADDPVTDVSRAALWAWDARPFPHFPARADVWADGAAWRRGHWLNGRAGAATLAEVVGELCARAGMTEVDVSALSGIVSGYVVDAPTTLGAALGALMDAWRFTAREREGVLVFAHADDADVAVLTAEDLLSEATPTRRADPEAAPMEVRLRYIDGARDYRIAVASARQRDFSGEDVLFIDAPLLLDADQAAALCDAALAEARAACVTAEIEVSPARLDLEPGDLVDFDGPMRIARIEDDAARKLLLVGTAASAPPVAGAELGAGSIAPVSRPHLVVLDLPPLPGAETDERPLAAVRAAPWRGLVQVFAGPSRDAATLRGEAGAAAGVGELLWALHPGPVGRWDEGNVTRIRMPDAALASVDARTLFAGANAFAVAQPDGGWEIVQARTVTLVDVDTWELRDLLRGQQGTETDLVAAPGAAVVLLDARPGRIALAAHEREAGLTVVAPPSGYPLSDARAAEADVAFADVWARPFAPAHVRGRRDGTGDVHLTWVRRTRLGGDAWQGEVPLGEEAESYRVTIRNAGVVVRVLDVAGPAATYPAADQIADFGALPATLSVTVAQVSARYGPGRGRDSILQL